MIAETVTVQYMTAIRTKDGHVTIFELEKKGTKYLHGVIVHEGDQGQIERNYWTAKFDKSEYRFLQGQRWDLKHIDQDFEVRSRKYRDQRQEAVREIEREEHSKMYDLVNGRISRWDTENPEPSHPMLDFLKTVGAI